MSGWAMMKTDSGLVSFIGRLHALGSDVIYRIKSLQLLCGMSVGSKALMASLLVSRVNLLLKC